MIIGYARVSTASQNLDRQTDALQTYGTQQIFCEKVTGKTLSRPELDKVRLVVRSDDTLVIESLSRLGRSTKDLLKLLEEFQQKGVSIVSLKENIDTRTATGKLLTSLFAAICEFERDVIADRVREGLAAARARGRNGGRPKKSAKAVETALKMHESKLHSLVEIQQVTGVSPSTLYRYMQ